jgi:uncharacterized YccA/Bax inhibitor family protein
MLGLVLLYWIGKYFYRLAEDYEKSKWGYAILGVVVYYLGTFIFAMLIAIFALDFLNDESDLVISLISLPFGILSCYLLYKYFEKTWEANAPKNDNIIDQIGKSGEDL